MCLDAPEEMVMICVITQHFNLNRILLLAIGLWPYQQSKLIRLQVILLFGMLTSFIIFQLAALLTAKLSFNFVIKVLSSVMFFITFTIIYYSFWINIQTVKCLFEQLQSICDELKDNNEIAIIEKYGHNAERYTAKVTMLGVCFILLTIAQPILPRILGIFLFINESRLNRTLLITTEYFIDQKKYFYLIWLHTNVAICIGSIASIATGMTLLGYLKYACGMFKIASYRIEQAMTVNMLKHSTPPKETTIHRKIIYAVDIHRKAMEFSEFLRSNYERSYFFLIAFGVASLSLNIFRMSQILSFKHDIEELLLPVICGFTIIFYMFFANYIGQEITDHNDDIYSTAYSARWYIAPLHIQKLLLFLLQRGSKSFGLDAGGLFVASLQCFASLVNASVSYFIVMYSTQQ